MEKSAKIMDQNGGGKDPEKYRYTRAIAFTCLWALMIINGFTIVTIYKTPSLAETYAVLYMAITSPMWLQIGWYMGISNGFGFKK